MKNPKRIEVARLAGVSESTVSRSLNDSPLISHQSKQKVKEAARRLGYVPSRQAALFARRRTYTLGFVVPSYQKFPPFSRAYFPALLDGAVLGAEERGYSVAIVLDRVEEPSRDYGALVRNRTYDGLLFAVTRSDYDRFRYFGENRIPFVLVNNYAEGLYSVDARPEPGMRGAFRHARELGHHRIGYVTGDMSYKNAVDRLTVFNRLAEEFGMQTVITEGDFSRTSGYRGTHQLLTAGTPPTLVMTSSDRAAMGVLQYCARKRDPGSPGSQRHRLRQPPAGNRRVAPAVHGGQPGRPCGMGGSAAPGGHHRWDGLGTGPALAGHFLRGAPVHRAAARRARRVSGPCPAGRTSA